MYKVIHWEASLVSENGFRKVEHYFTNVKKAIDYFFFLRLQEFENAAYVISVEDTEFVFMSHYSDDFSEELKPHIFTQSRTQD